MKFEPHQEILIPRRKNGLIDGERAPLSEFWSQVESVSEGLSEAVGCYVFAIKAGRGIKPWYVGKAERQSFKKECFTNHKLKHYNNAIAARKGSPYLFLISKVTAGGKFAKPSGNGHRDIEYLEHMLITMAIQKNRDLFNIRDTKLLREMVVPGILNNTPGPNPAVVKNLKALLDS